MLHSGFMKATTLGPTVAPLREAAVGRGARWPDMPGSDEETWARVRASSSVFSPENMAVSVSISEADWPEALAEAAAEGVSDEDWSAYLEAYKAQMLNGALTALGPLRRGAERTRQRVG